MTTSETERKAVYAYLPRPSILSSAASTTARRRRKRRRRSLKAAEATTVEGPASPPAKNLPVTISLRRISGTEEPNARRVKLATVALTGTTTPVLVAVVDSCGASSRGVGEPREGRR